MTIEGTPALSTLNVDQLSAQVDFWQRHLDRDGAGAGVALVKIAACKAEILRQHRAALAAYYGELPTHYADGSPTGA